MPTRILLKESFPPSHRASLDHDGAGEAPRRKAPPSQQLQHLHPHLTAEAFKSSPAAESSKPSSQTQRFHSKRRATSSFRSSLLSPPPNSDHVQSSRPLGVGGGDSPPSTARQPELDAVPAPSGHRRATNLRTNSLGASSGSNALSRSLNFGSHHSPSYDATDIRGSPRLLGYVFCLTACAIMLASVIQFYRSRGTVPTEFQSTFDSKRYFVVD